VSAVIPPDPDIHGLYELCVQNPDALVPLIRAIHASDPKVLGEDFSGTAALCRAWAQLGEGFRAIAVDLDAGLLARHGDHARVAKHACDVREIDTPCDALFVGNFSIGYFHTRDELVAYMKHARSRLSESGVFLCDTYGGDGAFSIGGVHRPTPMGDGRLCRYTWEQRRADPLTGMVTDVIHFRVEDAGVITHEFEDAFVYEWRLWSVPELRDAMRDAGFESTEVYAKLPDAVDDEGNAYATPIVDPEEELGEAFIVLVAGRAGRDP